MLSFKEYLEESGNWQNQLHSVSSKSHNVGVHHGRVKNVRPVQSRRPRVGNNYEIGHAAGTALKNGLKTDYARAKSAIKTGVNTANSVADRIAAERKRRQQANSTM